MKTLETAKDVLSGYGDFRESVITSITFNHFGTVVEITFNSLWSAGQRRTDLDLELPVVLRLSGVQEFHLVNALNQSQLEEPEVLDWGINEIAQAKADKSGEAGLTLTLLWEGERRLMVSFMDLTVQERPRRQVEVSPQ